MMEAAGHQTERGNPGTSFRSTKRSGSQTVPDAPGLESSHDRQFTQLQSLANASPQVRQLADQRDLIQARRDPLLQRVRSMPVIVGSEVLQAKLEGTIDEQTKKAYQVTYTGKKKDFKNGEEPAGAGITGVYDYSASAEVSDSVVGGDGAYRDNVNVGGNDREYHQGHILASALGGTGQPDNLFLQDGGQNTTGKWPSFERTVASYRDAGSPDAAMKYRVRLTGSNLKYNQAL